MHRLIMNNRRWEHSSEMLAITLVLLARPSRMTPTMSPVSDFYNIRSRASVDFRSISGFIYDLSWENERGKRCYASSKEKIQKRKLW